MGNGVERLREIFSNFRRTTFCRFMDDVFKLILVIYSFGIIGFADFDAAKEIVIAKIVIAVLMVLFYFIKYFHYTRVFIMGFAAQLMLHHILTQRPDLSTAAAAEIIKFVLVVATDLFALVLFCSVLMSVKVFYPLIKFVFYSMIALLTLLFHFSLESFDCLDLVSTFEEYKACKKDYGYLEAFSVSTLNIFVIYISVFEALSNVAVFLVKKRKREPNSPAEQG
ncbi:hypothetical protein [Paenibacillus sp. GCM10012303]|uniref:hypothetical protein n=1 Tax=Paenibacillus sp. GCM10012303 TaxID=3317340 RepID=UPI00361A9333